MIRSEPGARALTCINQQWVSAPLSLNTKYNPVGGEIIRAMSCLGIERSNEL